MTHKTKSGKSPTGRTVYIANLSGHNYSAAQRFGDLVPVTRGRVDIEHSDRLEADIHQVLEKAEEKDYILLGGKPIINVLACGYMYRRFGKVNVVFWDPLLQDYHTRELDFKGAEHPYLAEEASNG